MKHPAEADAIRSQMAGVRSALDENVHEIVTNARNLTDWKYYVRAAPWGAVGAAAALGYLAVPRRLEIMRPDASDLAELARQNRLVVQPAAQAQEKRSSGPTQMIVTMLTNAAMRAAMAYFSQQAGRIMGQEAADEEVHDEFSPGVR